MTEQSEQKNGSVCVFDFSCATTLEHYRNTMEQIKESLKKFCKSGTFQLETGKTGYVHFQGRISLKEKARLSKTVKLFHNEECLKTAHVSITSKENHDNVDYVTKEYTRTDGPWSILDDTPGQYVPRQIREIQKLYPWQEDVIKSLSIWDKRNINVLIDTVGNTGKSTLIGWIRAFKLGTKLPYSNDYKDIMQMVCNLPTSNAYLFDFPRCMDKDKLTGFYGAIEEIKNGYAYDMRYHFKEKNFDCPVVWIFTNTVPDKTKLSDDRWKLWEIKDMKLIPFITV